MIGERGVIDLIHFPWATLGGLYWKLAGGVALGAIAGRWAPPSAPARLGQALYWVGIPLGCVAFFRQADLGSGAATLAPAVAWVAIALGTGLTVGVLRLGWPSSRPLTWGSFWLAASFGNTGYLGFPVGLSLAGDRAFAWTLFYDLAGTTLGAYGLGSAVAARLGGQAASWRAVAAAALLNPTLWGAGLGLAAKAVPLPGWGEQVLAAVGWGVVGLSLVLLGMRLVRLQGGRSLPMALAVLGIKMLVVPLVLGLGLRGLGWSGAPLLALVLQSAMPPAFATLVLAEAYDLDRDLAVSAVALGSLALFGTLPLWVALFGVGSL